MGKQYEEQDWGEGGIISNEEHGHKCRVSPAEMLIAKL